LVQLGTASKIDGAVHVHRADLPVGINSAVVVTEEGRRIVMLDSSLDPVGRDVALFQCLTALDDHGKATFSAT
jgi:hypothetical protein